MGKFFKKNWFVILIVCIFTGISVYYIYDTNKGKLKGKSVDGESVVYSVNDENVTASTFYDDLYKSNGQNAIMQQFYELVANESFKTTKEIKNEASQQASSIRSNFESQYGSGYESTLQSLLAPQGYTDLEKYLQREIKLNKVTGEYAASHFDDLKIRSISYILIKYDDSTNPTDTPTETEQEKMDKVDAALKDGTAFADVASENSEDSSTASNGGQLGVIDINSTNLDADFLAAALALEEGETSDWVKSESFGYFRIHCDAATPETLENGSIDSPYEVLVSTYDTTLRNTAIWEKANSLGIDFKGNEDLEKDIKAALNITDDTSTDATASPEATSTPASSSK